MRNVQIGAFDPQAWSGLVVTDAPGRGFALGLAYETDAGRAEGSDLLYLIHELGPHAPDGSYARLSFDTGLPPGRGDTTPIVGKRDRTATLTWEWSRLDDTAVVRITSAHSALVELRAYFPWDWSGRWQADAGTLRGRTSDDQLALVAIVHAGRSGVWNVAGERAVLPVHVDAGRAVHAVLAIGPDHTAAGETAARISVPDTDARLDGAEVGYRDSRVAMEGRHTGLAESIANNIHWTVALQPETGRRYTPAGRRWIFPAFEGNQQWTIFCWDAFFNALLLAVEAPDLARDTLCAVLETQYENGNIPNWRGRFHGTPNRSQPPIGAFAVLKSFLRTGDRDLLAFAFPYLERWSGWWRADKDGHPRRDGNGNGLFNWGSDTALVIDSPAHWENGSDGRQKAAWESGQDDLPNWDEAQWDDAGETLRLDAVDLNSYLVLDYECMARIAAELGFEDKAAVYQRLRDALAARVDARLWNDDLGLYLDRDWDGTFSARIAASNFLPLLAGIPDDERAFRMLHVLESHFWGRFVLPTVSRSDPAFRDQQYWRGAIWPPMNYLIYHGLRRYGFDDAAAELAAKGADLFLTDWHRHQLCRENFDSQTGLGGGHRYQSWSPLFALMGLEEFIDVTPWDGLRIGNTACRGTGALHRIRVRGREWTITRSNAGTRIEWDGRLLLESDAPVGLRHVEYDERSLNADLECGSPVRMTFPADIDATIEPQDPKPQAPSPKPPLPPGRYTLSARSVGAP